MKIFEVRASYDDETITVYQAYSSEIATKAVEAQKLSASDKFQVERMTWIKPSWCWMMYRCGYSHKDRRQERVLALRMKHEHFQALLRTCRLSQATDRLRPGVVQWDPERGPRLEKRTYRSIQIGIDRSVVPTWVDEWIQSIEDVTDKAREMKRLIDGDSSLDQQKLEDMGLLPKEKAYGVPADIMEQLGMD